MRLMLRNGYPMPYPLCVSAECDQGLSENAASVQLILEGVVNFEVLHTVTVEFDSEESLLKAQAETGWDRWGSDTSLVLEALYDSGEGYVWPALILNTPFAFGEVSTPSTTFCGYMLVNDNA